MKVNKIMTGYVVVCDKGTIVKDVETKMKQYDIGFIPISDDKEIIGVVTDRDLVVRNAKPDDEIISYITPRIVTIDSNADIEDAAQMMGQEQVKRLLVKDGKKLVGVLSFSDIINHSDEEVIASTAKKIWTISKNTDKYHTDVDDFYL